MSQYMLPTLVPWVLGKELEVQQFHITLALAFYLNIVECSRIKCPEMTNNLPNAINVCQIV